MSLADLLLPLLRGIDPENAHRLTVLGLRAGLGGRQPQADPPSLATTLFGVPIPNPLGLAAGFDKHAEVPDAMLALGFGFVEVGGVTPLPQPGNPRPRVFRLAEDDAVINRYGFNSEGLERVARRLERRAGRPGLVGANLGANKDSADRPGDYVLGLRRLHALAGFLTVNISSPNTPGLRALQQRADLEALLDRLLEARAGIGASVPIALKIAPDLSEPERKEIALVALSRRLDGLVIANTTVRREGLRDPQASEPGGLSGRPLFAASTALLAEMYRLTGGQVPLIGCGGVFSGADAYAKIRAGATAVQLYTALIFRSPRLIGEIKHEMAARLRADGFAAIAEAVGADHK